MSPDTNSIKALIEQQMAFIAKASKDGSDSVLVDALKEELASLESNLRKLEGTPATIDEVDGEGVEYKVKRLLSRSKALETSLDERNARRVALSNLKKAVNADYDWYADPINESAIADIDRDSAELTSVRKELIKFQGAMTFAVGFDENTTADEVFSPDLTLRLKKEEAIKKLFTKEIGEPLLARVSELSEADIAMMAATSGKPEVRTHLTQAIWSLARSEALRNFSAARKFFDEAKETPMDKIWKQVNRHIKKVGRALGLYKDTDPNWVPSLEEIEALVTADDKFNPEAQKLTISISLEQWQAEAGATWDESIMEVVNFLVDINVAKVTTRAAKAVRVDVSAMERLYEDMRKPLSNKAFSDHADPEIRAAALAGGHVWAAFREQFRLKINSLKNERARRGGRK